MIVLKPAQQQIMPQIILLQQKLAVTQKQWQIYDGNFNQYDVKKILLAAIQINTLKMILYQNYNGLLNDLTLCSFPTLQVLNLSLNNIESLEPISCLTMPKLKSLTLFKNRISQIKSLRKANFPNLQQLLLNNNSINEFEALEQCQFTNIQKLFLNINKSPEVNSVGFKICCPKGMEQYSIRNNCLRMSRRIQQKLQTKMQPSPQIYS